MWRLRSRDIKDLFKITQPNLKVWASPFPSPHLHSSSFFFHFKNWNEINIQRWDCLRLTATITTRLQVKQLSFWSEGADGKGEERIAPQTQLREQEAVTQKKQRLGQWLGSWECVGRGGKGITGLAVGENKKVDNQQLKIFMSKSHDLERTVLQKNTPGGKLDEKDHFPETLKLPRWR